MGQHITDIEGVFAGAVRCGISSSSAPEKKDLAFISVPHAVGSAGVFTLNKFRAPCLDYSKQCLDSGTVKAVVINSGNANATTGVQGFKNAQRTAEIAASYLKLSPKEVAVSSTGIIGVQLPMDKIESGLSQLLQAPTVRDGALVAEAIMTTDLFPKSVFKSAEIDGAMVQVAGIAKGAGMIAPNMGTMLGFLITDANLDSNELQIMLQAAVDLSFNMVSVDSDTSTNDMVLAFATGTHKVDLARITNRSAIQELLDSACVDLAKLIARDGEGATKLIEVQVHGSTDASHAKRIALSILNSPLVKTAVYGADPNWGRIVMAIGKTENVEVDPSKVDVYLGNHQVFAQGAPLPFQRSEVSNALRGKDVLITVDLNLGPHKATGWGCDLTEGYIDVNTAYS